MGLWHIPPLPSHFVPDRVPPGVLRVGMGRIQPLVLRKELESLVENEGSEVLALPGVACCSPHHLLEPSVVFPAAAPAQHSVSMLGAGLL